MRARPGMRFSATSTSATSSRPESCSRSCGCEPAGPHGRDGPGTTWCWPARPPIAGRFWHGWGFRFDAWLPASTRRRSTAKTDRLERWPRPSPWVRRPASPWSSRSSHHRLRPACSDRGADLRQAGVDRSCDRAAPGASRDGPTSFSLRWWCSGGSRSPHRRHAAEDACAGHRRSPATWHDRPLDCAASYKLEESGIVLFETSGPRTTRRSSGLPLIRLTTILARLGLPVP